jgi:hypothetical protein
LLAYAISVSGLTAHSLKFGLHHSGGSLRGTPLNRSVEPQVFADKEVGLVYVDGNSLEAKKVEASLTEEGNTVESRSRVCPSRIGLHPVYA